MALVDEVTQQVFAFAASELGVRPDRLRLETRLFHDLSCDGDDAVDLLTHFAQQFGVDVSAFDFDQHFGSEAGFNPLAYAYLWLLCPGRLRRKPLTVGQLTEAARSKRLRSSDALAV